MKQIGYFCYYPSTVFNVHFDENSSFGGNTLNKTKWRGEDTIQRNRMIEHVTGSDTHLDPPPSADFLRPFKYLQSIERKTTTRPVRGYPVYSSIVAIPDARLILFYFLSLSYIVFKNKRTFVTLRKSFVAVWHLRLISWHFTPFPHSTLP